MQAIVYSEYGPPDVLRVAALAKPVPKKRQILVQVRAASLNPLDWHLVRGEPRFLRLMGKPKDRILGGDVAGQVEAVGAQVEDFRPGDAVFGTCRGSFAEYACGNAEHFAHKPPELPFEQAAAIPVAACTALQALRDYGRVEPGQNVLINGASGGVGTFAVQIAKALGAVVTGVCSSRNVELVRSIGADQVIDYTAEDFTREDRRYDLIVQVAGNRTVPELLGVVAPKGSLVVVGGGVGREEQESGGGMLEVMSLMIKGQLLSRFVRQRALLFMAKIRRSDLELIAELIEAGKLRPVIDRTYPLTQAAEAIRYLEGGHARGKVILSLSPENRL